MSHGVSQQQHNNNTMTTESNNNLQQDTVESAIDLARSTVDDDHHTELNVTSSYNELSIQLYQQYQLYSKQMRYTGTVVHYNYDRDYGLVQSDKNNVLILGHQFLSTDTIHIGNIIEYTLHRISDNISIAIDITVCQCNESKSSHKNGIYDDTAVHCTPQVVTGTASNTTTSSDTLHPHNHNSVIVVSPVGSTLVGDSVNTSSPINRSSISTVNQHASDDNVFAHPTKIRRCMNTTINLNTVKSPPDTPTAITTSDHSTLLPDDTIKTINNDTTILNSALLTPLPDSPHSIQSTPHHLLPDSPTLLPTTTTNMFNLSMAHKSNNDHTDTNNNNNNNNNTDVSDDLSIRKRKISNADSDSAIQHSPQSAINTLPVANRKYINNESNRIEHGSIIQDHTDTGTTDNTDSYSKRARTTQSHSTTNNNIVTNVNLSELMHSLPHIDDSKYISVRCELCNKSFNHSSQLTEHIKSKRHQHLLDIERIGRDKLVCELCNMTFTSINDKDKHLRGRPHNTNVQRMNHSSNTHDSTMHYNGAMKNKRSNDKPVHYNNGNNNTHNTNNNNNNSGDIEQHDMRRRKYTNSDDINYSEYNRGSYNKPPHKLSHEKEYKHSESSIQHHTHLYDPNDHTIPHNIHYQSLSPSHWSAPYPPQPQPPPYIHTSMMLPPHPQPPYYPYQNNTMTQSVHYNTATQLYHPTNRQIVNNDCQANHINNNSPVPSSTFSEYAASNYSSPPHNNSSSPYYIHSIN